MALLNDRLVSGRFGAGRTVSVACLDPLAGDIEIFIDITDRAFSGHEGFVGVEVTEETPDKDDELIFWISCSIEMTNGKMRRHIGMYLQGRLPQIRLPSQDDGESHLLSGTH
jgi:hypothetical protein